MISAPHHLVPTGLLLPTSVLQSDAFAILAAFVAINTVMFAALAVVKILPTVHPLDWLGGRNRRAATRSIHPDERVSRPAAAPSGSRGRRTDEHGPAVEVDPGEHAAH